MEASDLKVPALRQAAVALGTDPHLVGTVVDALRHDNSTNTPSEAQCFFNLMVFRLVAILKAGTDAQIWPCPEVLSTKDAIKLLFCDFEVPGQRPPAEEPEAETEQERQVNEPPPRVRINPRPTTMVDLSGGEEDPPVQHRMPQPLGLQALASAANTPLVSMHLMDSQFVGGSASGIVTPIINGGRLSNATARYAKTNSSAHPYALVLGVIMPPLIVMGFDPHNIHLGFKIDANHAGAHGKAGSMPHFLRDAATWRDWWNRLTREAAQSGQCAMLTAAMMNLAAQVNTWMMVSEEDEAEAWLTAAHRLLSRYDKFCAQGTLEALEFPTCSEEKDLAKMRARSVMPTKPAWTPGPRRPGQSSGGGGGGGYSNKRRRGPNNGKDLKFCDHHKLCGHTTAECDILHPKPKASAGSSNGK